MKRPKILDIHTPVDFQSEYLTGTDSFICPFCYTDNSQNKTSFLQIATLEQIKNLHKHDSFTSARRKFYTIVLVTSGTINETIGHTNYTFQKGDLYFISQNQLHSIHSWSDDVQGYHCIFDSEYFLLCLKNQVKLNQFPFFRLEDNHRLSLSEQETELFVNLLLKLSKEYDLKKTHNDDLLVRLYLNILLIEVERVYLQKNAVNTVNLSRKEVLVTKFKNLVRDHLTDHLKVSEYAGKLFVNPHYLNDTIKEVTGISASEYINTELLLYAKSYLIQTDHTIAEIAELLNFTDQSYFSRFFKKQTEITPSEFRAHHIH